jgi:hypothetical protein
MKVIEFTNLVEFPAFENFRIDVLEAENTIKAAQYYINLFNEKLKEFNAVYEYTGTQLDQNAIRVTRIKRKVIFASEEDYVHFCLKWS